MAIAQKVLRQADPRIRSEATRPTVTTQAASRGVENEPLNIHREAFPEGQTRAAEGIRTLDPRPSIRGG